MDETTSFHLAQDRETPTSYNETGRFFYRVAYARSADSHNNNEPGQDYLTWAIDGQRFAFALCDGVSQSFYGDLAARILGDRLLEWARNANLPSHPMVHANLINELNVLTDEAIQIVNKYPIPAHIPPMLRAVLDKKRALGSEATFVAGFIDFTKNEAAFIWMGDSRLHLWQGNEELRAFDPTLFKTSERWSTVKGPVGELHLVLVPPTDFDHLAAYSDGFSYLDTALEPAKAKHPFSHHAINHFIADAAQRPSSDDISFLEIWTTPKPPPFPQKDENLAAPKAQYRYQSESHFLAWPPVSIATEYEVKISSENQTTLTSTKISTTEWQSDGELDVNARLIAIRAWQNQEPGNWSDFLRLENIAPPVAYPHPEQLAATPPVMPPSNLGALYPTDESKPADFAPPLQHQTKDEPSIATLPVKPKIVARPQKKPLGWVWWAVGVVLLLCCAGAWGLTIVEKSVLDIFNSGQTTTPVTKADATTVLGNNSLPTGTLTITATVSITPDITQTPTPSRTNSSEDMSAPSL